MDYRILNGVRSPASYLGCEWGAVRKTPENDGPRWVLAFPDAYEIGMSHLGIQILYHILNTNPESSAERVFAPKLDMQEALLKLNEPLRSLETQTPLREFDVIGFSLPYELGYTNVLRMLRLGGVPLHASERSDADPLVIAGGPCVTNPAPVEAFFDAFAIGEGEDVVLEINRAVHGTKRKGVRRVEALEALSKIEGMYVPQISRRVVTSRKVADLDAAPFPTSPVVPSVETTHDRAVIEIARGCPHACRFCHAGYIGRPHRERSPQTVWKLALELLKNTGYQDVTFLSLSAGDYQCLPELVAALAAQFGQCGIAVSLPSLRANSLTNEVVQLIRSMRKTGFTIAPEAGSERLRGVINKDITEEEALRTAHIVFTNGWDLIKLYFMFGLPTETEDDLRELAGLVRAVRKEGLAVGIKPRINVGLSAFVPKPHTAFQWEAMLDEKEISERLDKLLSSLKMPGVNVKWSPPFMSVLEGVFARGDARLAAVIEKAENFSAAFDAWGDGLKPDVWRRAFDDAGLDPAEFASRPRPLDTPLPWEHIRTGVARDWLLDERKKSLAGQTTLGCENAPCPEPCGGCDGKAQPVKYDKTKIGLPIVMQQAQGENFVRYRLVYLKTGPAAYLGHLDTARVFQRSLRRAGVELKYTEGFHPKPKMSFGDALALGIESRAEMLDAWIHRLHSPDEILSRVNTKLPEGFGILSVSQIDASAPSIEEATTALRFVFEVNGAGTVTDILREKAALFENLPNLWIEKETKSGTTKVDLKTVVGELKIGDGSVEMEMIVSRDRNRVRPQAAYEAIFGPLPQDARIIKTAVMVKN